MDVAEFNCPLAFKLAKYLAIAASFGDFIYLAYSRRRPGGPEQVKAGRELWMSPGFSCRGGISVGQFVHHLCGAGSHFDPSTCFDGSETRVPSGYTKGRHLWMAAFPRSITSSGNHFEHRLGSRSLRLGEAHVSPSPRARRRSAPISPETLGCLCVSPRPG